MGLADALTTWFGPPTAGVASAGDFNLDPCGPLDRRRGDRLPLGSEF